MDTFGYTTFRYDITDQVHYGIEANINPLSFLIQIYLIPDGSQALV